MAFLHRITWNGESIYQNLFYAAVNCGRSGESSLRRPGRFRWRWWWSTFAGLCMLDPQLGPPLGPPLTPVEMFGIGGREGCGVSGGVLTISGDSNHFQFLFTKRKINPQNLFFCKLNSLAKFQNPTIAPSMRKISDGEKLPQLGRRQCEHTFLRPVVAYTYRSASTHLCAHFALPNWWAV